MAVHLPGFHGDYLHHPNIRLLLVWSLDSGKVPVRADSGCRQEEGWAAGVAVWFWRPRPCSAISVWVLGGETYYMIKSDLKEHAVSLNETTEATKKEEESE